MRHNLRKHKYNAKPTVVDGIRFDSKKEAQYYVTLKLRVTAGEVLTFLRQVPIALPGNTTLRIDFLEFWSNGEMHFIDVKGYMTPEFKLKKRQVESLYPFEIEIV